MSIKKRFEKLKRKEQIQLYGIVLICYILVFVFYEDISNKFFSNTLETTQKVFYNPVKNQAKRLSNLELYQYLNEIVKKYDIDLVETKITQNSMKIETRGEFEDIISFMKKYDHNFIIESYKMEQMFDNTIALSLSVNIKNFYDNKNIKKDDIKSINPYILEAENNSLNKTTLEVKKKFPNIQDTNIIISAIIGLEVLIQTEWYTIGDIYRHYKVMEIGKRSVVFLNIKTKKETIRRIINE